jgi:hypothetical protein
MDTSIIIEFVDSEIARLEQVKVLLNGDGTQTGKRGRPKSKPAAAHSFDHGQNAAPAKKRRKMSAEGRARIAAAQKARWAKAKRG